MKALESDPVDPRLWPRVLWLMWEHKDHVFAICMAKKGYTRTDWCQVLAHGAICAIS